MSKVFIVYMMANRKNGTLYIGVTSNPVGRVQQHKSDFFNGFTKRYGVHRLVWFEPFEDARAAIQREKRLKEWRRDWKISLIEETNPDWRDLYQELAGMLE